MVLEKRKVIRYYVAYETGVGGGILVACETGGGGEFVLLVKLELMGICFPCETGGDGGI